MDAIAIYEKYLTDLIRVSEKEWRASCPFHDDSTPSLYINEKTSQFYCFGCAEAGNLKTFLDKVGGSEDVREIRSTERLKSFVLVQHEGISSSVVQQLHRNLMNDTRKLEYVVRKRRISLFTVKKFLLGYDTQTDRIAFPIKSRSGKFANIKLHNSEKNPKSLSWRSGSGKARIYPVSAMLHRKLVITEGEFDTLVLQSNGYHSITSTAGAGSFPDRWYALFREKEVKILLDGDNAGFEGATRIWKGLQGYAKEVQILTYPKLEFGKDVTDYVVAGNNIKQLIGEWR